MELIVLGSGSYAPSLPGPVRNPAGYAVKLGRRLLLLDLGFGNARQLARAGLEASDVSDVLLSHRHPDHVGDLPALLFHFRYGPKPRSGRLRLWGPRGLKAFLRRLSAAHAPWLGPRGYRLEVRELAPGEEARGEGWRAETLKVPHPTPALAYRLHYRGKSLAYSGDTGSTPALSAFAAGADLLVIECTVPEREAMDGHLTPRQALALVRDSACRRALLSHLSAESAREARGLLPRGGRVRLASDLLRAKV